MKAIRQRRGASAENTTVIGFSQAASLTVALRALRPDVAANVVLGSGALPPGLTVRQYDIPHVMSPAMTNDISRWIRAR